MRWRSHLRGRHGLFATNLRTTFHPLRITARIKRRGLERPGRSPESTHYFRYGGVSTMKAFSLALAIALAFAGTARAAELTSGLQPGDLVGAFNVEKCGGAVNDGREVGANFCYRCMLGNKPTVMIFARKADDKLASLAKELDKHVAKNSDQ